MSSDKKISMFFLTVVVITCLVAEQTVSQSLRWGRRGELEKNQKKGILNKGTQNPEQKLEQLSSLKNCYIFNIMSYVRLVN